METAKTGSKLAQLQALRQQKQAVRPNQADRKRVAEQAVTVVSPKLSVAKSYTVSGTRGRITCPHCGHDLTVRPKTGAERMRASRARRKK